ncbi:MAG TPA: hypothetical protein VNV60_05220 [Holophagaceae bacterium]|jgi:hypothetical protein|nr:hypothetical protein [Holophagaceae bacterium]
MRRILSTLTVTGLALSAQTPVPKPGAPIPLPVRWSENSFFVQPRTPKGETLQLYTDTGGGLLLLESTVKRLNLSVEAGDPPSVKLPPFDPAAWIPDPQGNNGALLISPPPPPGRPGSTADGQLGQAWFADRCWTFDYPGHRLLLRAVGDLPQVDPGHRVVLGFQTDKTGQRQANFPRIQASVDDEVLDLLFDTGATTIVQPQALQAIGDGRPAERATSFITATTFERWHQRHPGWRVVASAEAFTGAPMIEVPSMEVGGYATGPVWFTQRPDKAFHEFMSQWMDRRVEGALGGNAMRTFRVTVDYPSATAVFELRTAEQPGEQPRPPVR